MLTIALSCMVVGITYSFLMPAPFTIGPVNSLYPFVFSLIGAIVGYSAMRALLPRHPKKTRSRRRIWALISLAGVLLSASIVSHNLFFRSLEPPLSTGEVFISFASIMVAAILFQAMSVAFWQIFQSGR